MNRLKTIRVARPIIDTILRSGWPASRVVGNPLPDDAELLAVHFDGRTVGLTYRSESFDPVTEGGDIPSHEVYFES